MTVYTPTYRVTIAGVVQTSTTLQDGTITYGRNDFFEATQPSYCNIELLNLDGTSPVVELLDTVLIEVTDSTGAYIKLFTGEVSGVYNRFEGAGLGLRAIYLSSVLTEVGLPNTVKSRSFDITCSLNFKSKSSISVCLAPLSAFSRIELKNFPNIGGKLAFINSKPLISSSFLTTKLFLDFFK